MSETNNKTGDSGTSLVPQASTTTITSSTRQPSPTTPPPPTAATIDDDLYSASYSHLTDHSGYPEPTVPPSMNPYEDDFSPSYNYLSNNGDYPNAGQPLSSSTSNPAPVSQGAIGGNATTGQGPNNQQSGVLRNEGLGGNGVPGMGGGIAGTPNASQFAGSNNTNQNGSGSNTNQFGGGSNTVQSGGGSNPNQFGGGSNTNQSGGGSNPNQFGGGSNTNQSGGGSNPNQSGGGSNTIQSGGGSNPNQFGGGSNTNQSGGGSNPNQFGGGSNTNQSGGGSNPNQFGGGSNTNQIGDLSNTTQNGGANSNTQNGNVANINQNAGAANAFQNLDMNNANQNASGLGNPFRTLNDSQNNTGGAGAPNPVDTSGITASSDSKDDKEWISKFELFTLKFLNKIFRRTQIERKMKNAVKPSPTCKKGIPPEQANQLHQPNNPQQGTSGAPSAGYDPQADGFSPAPETEPQQDDEADEAQTVSDLNAMLDQIAQEIPLISQQYVSLVTPLLSSLVELKGRDFRKTDNREIFRKVDDYQSLIKCDAHICLQSVTSRLQSLVNFIEGIKTDSLSLRKFPKILTKCYSTESKICQEVCEVYSDDDFQTVNIKRMFKLKPKPPERPPWRLTYKSGNECFNYGQPRNASCAKSQQQMPGTSCGQQQQAIISSSSCPARGKPGAFGGFGYSSGFPSTGAGGSCGSKSSCGNCDCSKTPRFYSSYPKLSRRKYNHCSCGCCDEEKIPNICGTFFTRFRQIDPDDAPMMVEGHPIEEDLFPSVTNFQQIRELDIPRQKLFMEPPKCCNPMPPKARPVCFGGAKVKKGFPCGAKNTCCKDSCKPRRDPLSCCGTGKKKRSKRRGNSCKRGKEKLAAAECYTSTTALNSKNGCAAEAEQQQCQKDVLDMFGMAMAQVENMNSNNNGMGAPPMMDNVGNNFAQGMYGNLGGLQQPGPGGMVATQTMSPPMQNMQFQTDMQPQYAPQFMPQQMPMQQQQQFSNGYSQQQQEAYKQTQTQNFQQPQPQPGQYQGQYAPQPPSPNGVQFSQQPPPPNNGGQYSQPAPQEQFPQQPPPPQGNQYSQQAPQQYSQSQSPITQQGQQPPGYQAQYNYDRQQQMSPNPQSTFPQNSPSQQQTQSNPFFGGQQQQHQAFKMEQNEQPLDQLAKILQQNLVIGQQPVLPMQPQRPETDANKKQVFARFIAQMYAAGTVSREEAEKMTGLICQRLPLQGNLEPVVLQVMQAHVSTQTLKGPQPPSRPASANPSQPQQSSRSPSPQPQTYSRSMSPQRQPQAYQQSSRALTPTQNRDKGSSMANLRASQNRAGGGVRAMDSGVCGPDDGCPTGIMRGRSSGKDEQERMRVSAGAAATGNRVSYAATQTFVSPSGRISHDVRNYRPSDGRSDRTILSISAGKHSIVRDGRGSRCSARTSQCSSKCSRVPRRSRSTCPRKSGTSIHSGDPDRVSSRPPSAGGYCTPPSFGNSRASSPRTSGNYPDDPGSRRSTFPGDPDPGSRKSSCPPIDFSSRRSSRVDPDDPGSRKNSYPPDDPGSRKNSYPPDDTTSRKDSFPPPDDEGYGYPPGYEPDDGDGKNKNRSPSGERTPEEKSPKASPKTSPANSPKTSPQPSPPTSPKSPKSEKTESVSSHSPPASAKSTLTGDETDGLVWPEDPPRGPLDKPPVPPPSVFPPVPKTKPGKNYTSPFKFKKIKIPPPPACDVLLNDLPDCHPLKTPYPPQYRFDNLKMRRYLEQCNLKKQICNRPQGEQCWVPPPPPLPPQARDKKSPFPPDKCFANDLFPYAKLGMGCNMGLPSGNCYGQYFDSSNNNNGNKYPKPDKAADCFFDCGGICPMGMLGENCPPPPPPPYAKLKKKSKPDDVFFFDYITVMRDKKPETIPDADQCELYKQKLLAEQQMIEEKCKGKKGKKKKKNSNDCDPNEICATPEITRFLNRPDVQVVKEQKTEIVRKHGMEGPERMITQMEAFYTKSPDGRVTTQWNDPNANNDGITTTLPVNVSPGVEQWVKAEVDASARKNDHSHRFADDCPQLQTQWEKEFQEFVRSCDRPKKTKKNAAQYGMPMPPPPPPGMIPCPLPETTPIMCRVQDPNNMSGNVIQCQAVPFPMNNKQKHLQFGTEGACIGGSPYQQTWPYANNRGGGQTSPQPVGGQYPIPPPSAYSQQSGYAPIPPPPQYMQVYNEQPQQQFQTTYPPPPAEGALPYEQNSNEENQFTAPPPPPQFQQAPSGIPSPPTQYQQVSNGYSKYAPYQPIKVAEAAMDISQQEPKRSSRDSGKKADYPYMCEVRYHEPITGSIYGKLVTRQQPCRLVESSSVPPDHNPECPVMMETPFFNPSCPLPKNSQLDPRKPQTN